MVDGSCLVFDEPRIEFRFEQPMVDPRDGLSLFGPYSADSSAHPLSITYAVIGTNQGIAALRSWSAASVNRF